jgi:serine/threonine protein kinase
MNALVAALMTSPTIDPEQVWSFLRYHELVHPSPERSDHLIAAGWIDYAENRLSIDKLVAALRDVMSGPLAEESEPGLMLAWARTEWTRWRSPRIPPLEANGIPPMPPDWPVGKTWPPQPPAPPTNLPANIRTDVHLAPMPMPPRPMPPGPMPPGPTPRRSPIPPPRSGGEANHESDRTLPPAKTDGFGFRDQVVVTPLDDASRGRAGALLAERYVPLRPLSAGGMGRILLVEERHTGRQVALKLMNGVSLQNAELVQQFIREAVITARLDHPNIIPIYELGFLNSDQLYYTMRYVPDGVSFSALVGSSDRQAQLRVLLGAARALDHAHKQGLWHRDFKPDNVMIGRLGETYVIDWGLVTVQPGRRYPLELPSLQVRWEEIQFEDMLPPAPAAARGPSAASGLLVGTPNYMAPEQVERDDSKQGAHSDVWAVGLILRQIFTGQHPVQAPGDNAYSLMNKMAQIVFRPLRQEAPTCPPELAQLADLMLVREPQRREPNLRRLIALLERMLDAAPPALAALASLPSPTPMPTPRDVVPNANKP